MIINMKVRLTTEHPTSSYGIPVFVVGREPLDYADGIKAARKQLGVNTWELGRLLGISGRTVEGYEQGRIMPSKPVLLLLQQILK